MSAVDTLTAAQNGDGVLEPIETLALLLDLPSVNVSVLQVRTYGQGSRAAVEIVLSNGDTMCFDSVRDMTRPANLAAELVACAGTVPKLNQARALQVAALVRKLAEREATLTDNEIAADWGASYLQAADTIDVDLNDQAHRWAAFSRLEHHDPFARSRENGTSVATADIVLRHRDGSRLVRAGWFFQHVRTLDAALSQSTLATRMARVGWTRRGGSGRIKATAPGRQATLGWNFWTVPTAWEHDR